MIFIKFIIEIQAEEDRWMYKTKISNNNGYWKKNNNI
jgi:hypothetical protein